MLAYIYGKNNKLKLKLKQLKNSNRLNFHCRKQNENVWLDATSYQSPCFIVNSCLLENQNTPKTSVTFLLNLGKQHLDFQTVNTLNPWNTNSRVEKLENLHIPQNNISSTWLNLCSPFLGFEGLAPGGEGYTTPSVCYYSMSFMVGNLLRVSRS